MEKIRFAVAGSGWRAMYYVRIAKSLPEIFELTGVLCHGQEKAEAFEKEHGIPAFWKLEDLIASRPEFVVSCVSKTGMTDMVRTLLENGMPAMSETPFGLTTEAINGLYETWKRTGVTLGIAEQYYLFASHRARRALLDRGLLGTVSSCALTMMHDYHAVSILRWYLGEESGPVRIHSMERVTPIVMTGGRGGMITDGRIGEESRYITQIDYGDGRLGLYDFSGIQYRSYIRTSHLRILGDRGEIFDDEIRYVGEGNMPVMKRLEYVCDEKTGTLRAVKLDNEALWENPFRTDVIMSEDEIAIAEALCGMGEKVRTGNEPLNYCPVKWGLRDAYVSRRIMDAAENGETLTTDEMPWDRE